MQAGLGGPLCALHSGHPHTVIGAIVFASKAPPPDGRDETWMRWGTLLALHGDLADDDWYMWMEAGAEDLADTDIAPWLSFRSLKVETYHRICGEAWRRRDQERQAHDVLEQRQLAMQAGRIAKSRIGRAIMRSAEDDHNRAQAEKWPKLSTAGLCACADGVLTEFRRDDRCEDCGGTGISQFVVDWRRHEVNCPRCHGTGITHLSDRERARMIGTNNGTYPRNFKQPYEWLYQEALTARRAAVRQLRVQLHEEPEMPAAAGSVRGNHK